MVCPNCGGTNFQWASVCDHCRHALPALTSQPATPVSDPAPVADGSYVDQDAVDEQRFRASLAAATPPVFATTFIIAANALVFAVMTARGVSATSPSAEVLIRWGADYGPRVVAGEWWRLFSAIFVHAGIVHLAMNMLALVSSGRLVERLFGQPAFVVLYAVSGLTASLASVAVHPVTVSVGASGAISGVYGGIIAFVLFRRASMPASLRSSIGGNMAAFVGYNAAFGLLNPRIDMVAHGAGLAAGVIVGAALATAPGSANRGRILRAAVVTAVSGVLLVTAARRLPAFDDWGTTMAVWLKSSATTDALYSEAAGQLAAMQLTPAQFADRIEREMVPQVAAQEVGIRGLRLPPAQQQQAERVTKYLALKKEALALTAKAERSGDDRLMDAAGKRTEDALAAMLAFAPNAEASRQIGDLIRNREMERAFIEALKRVEQFESGCAGLSNQLLKRLRVNHLPPREFAFQMEHDVVAPWKAEQRRFQSLRVPPARNDTRERVLEYMTLRGDAWQLVADGIRASNPALVQQANEKQTAAMSMLSTFKAQPEVRNPQ